MYHFNFDFKVLVDIGSSANQETNARLLFWGELADIISRWKNLQLL